jgi:hypothetical protein
MASAGAQPARGRLRLSGMRKRRATREAIAAAALSITVFTAVTGCQQSGPDGITAGTITGRLLRVGGPAPGSPVPLSGSVTAAAPGGHPSATVSVGKNGRFTIRNLPVGRYRLTGTSPLIDSGHATCSAAASVRLRTGRVSHADVICSIS